MKVNNFTVEFNLQSTQSITLVFIIIHIMRSHSQKKVSNNNRQWCSNKDKSWGSRCTRRCRIEHALQIGQISQTFPSDSYYGCFSSIATITWSVLTCCKNMSLCLIMVWVKEQCSVCWWIVGMWPVVSHYSQEVNGMNGGWMDAWLMSHRISYKEWSLHILNW